MRDITNYRDNLGKEPEDRRVQLDMSWSEFCAIVALAQNPHPNYQNCLQNMDIYREIFETGKSIQNYMTGFQIRVMDNDLPL